MRVTLRDVCFVDTLRGWAIGDSATIIATTDGGKTWHRQRSPVDSITLEKVQFVNKYVGYIVGWAGTILSTKDGGTTWVLNDSGTQYRLRDLSFVNQKTGWVAGGDPRVVMRRPGVILRTHNGGQTWEKQLEPEPLWQLFSAIAFVDADHGWALASDYSDNFSFTTVYRTSDGGQQWTIVGEVHTLLFTMSVVSADTIWAGGFGFVKSLNGGRDWGLDYSIHGTVQDIAQLDGRTGWVIHGSEEANKISFTDDGGATWTELLVQRGPALLALTNIGRDYLWTVGDSGVVMSYKNPMRSGSPQENPAEEPPPQNYESAHHYPNPFNSILIIRFSLAVPQDVTLTIYDLRGRQITVLLSQPLAPGTHSVTWDGKDRSNRRVASGVYFYQLRLGNVVVTKKAVLLR